MFLGDIHNNFARIAGRDEPAGHVLQRAVNQRNVPLTLAAVPREDDYALIDMALAVAPLPDGIDVEPARPGIGYAGMTPLQRAAFLSWLADPSQPAPIAFQDLYVAQLEVRLLEGGSLSNDVHLHLRFLRMGPGWQGNDAIVRAILLGYWLAQDGAGLCDWLTQAPLSAQLLSVGLGLQAMTGAPLTVNELTKIGVVWNLSALTTHEEEVRMRLASLCTYLDADPLAYCLDTLGEAAMKPRPWRSAHRGLRFALPQPALRPQIEPLLADMATVQAAQMPADRGDVSLLDDAEAQVGEGAEETLILEFGESRSEYFEYVLHLAQGLDGFSQLMDEDRRLVYRMYFQKNRLRKFWRIWEYVQNWSSTRVYVDGEEIERWKVWPYSQFLR